MANHPPYWYWDNKLNLKEVKKLNKLIMSKYDFIEPIKHKAYNEDGSLKKNTDSYVITYKKVKVYISKLLDLVNA